MPQPYPCDDHTHPDDDWVQHERVFLTRDWLRTRNFRPLLEGENDSQHGYSIEKQALRRRSPSDLGAKLRAIRKRIVASGVPLLSWDEINAEIANRRGETS